MGLRKKSFLISPYPIFPGGREDEQSCPSRKNILVKRMMGSIGEAFSALLRGKGFLLPIGYRKPLSMAGRSSLKGAKEAESNGSSWGMNPGAHRSLLGRLYTGPTNFNGWLIRLDKDGENIILSRITSRGLPIHGVFGAGNIRKPPSRRLVFDAGLPWRAGCFSS
jgi:hypothetical protein